MSIRVAIFLLSAFLVMGVAAQNSVAPEEEKELPAYVKLVDTYPSADSFNMSDSLFYKISGSTFFQVSKFDLNHKDKLIKDLKEWILPKAKQQDWELVGIVLRGAASPEGPYNFNVMLSQKRAKALTDFLVDNMGQTHEDILAVNTTAEDYTSLILLMEEKGDKDVGLVRSLLAACNGDMECSKNVLMKAQGGKLWKRLLKEYFPKLRAARIVLFFKWKKLEEKNYEPVFIISPEEIEVKDTTKIPTTIQPIIIPMQTISTRRHVLSVSTNLLYDGFYMPNFGWGPMLNVELEYYRKEARWTYLAAFTSPYYHRWNKNKFFQIRDYHLELRRYFKQSDLHTGAFLAGYINANKYGIGLSKTKGWQGEGVGAALKTGYVGKLCKSGRWRLEVCAAFGGYITHYDPYIYGNPVTGKEDGDYYYDYTGQPSDFKKRNYQRIWLGPTEFGLKLRYDLLYRRIYKKGVSFNRKEAWHEKK